MAGRNHEIRFKVSKEEYDKIKKKCDEADISISSFMRVISLKSTLKVEISGD